MSLAIERALTSAERAELTVTVASTMRELALHEDAPPALVLESIEAYVVEWRKPLSALLRRAGFGNSDREQVAFSLGVLWGYQMVRRFGWEWTAVAGDGEEMLCVVSQNRALVLYPVQVMVDALAGVSKTPEALRAYRFIEAGHVSALPPGCLEDVLNELAMVV